MLVSRVRSRLAFRFGRVWQVARFARTRPTPHTRSNQAELDRQAFDLGEISKAEATALRREDSHDSEDLTVRDSSWDNLQVCRGCGVKLQSEFPDAPGYVPAHLRDSYVERQREALQQYEAAKARAAFQNQRAALLEAIASVEPGSEAEKRLRTELAGLEEDARRKGLLESAERVQPTQVPVSPPRTDSAPRPEAAAVLASLPASVRVLNPGLFPSEAPPVSPPQPPPFPVASGSSSDLSAAVASGLVEPEEVDWEAFIAKRLQPLRCVRCHQLQHYGLAHGHVAAAAPEAVRQLLRDRLFAGGKARSSVILNIVDLFDVQGSLVKDLVKVVGGRNPIILVGNKFDLLPEGAGVTRVTAWLKREAQLAGLNVAGVGLVSAATKAGLYALMGRAKALAARHAALGHRDIYLVGTANVGKSTLVKALISCGLVRTKGTLVDKEGNLVDSRFAAPDLPTTSVLPGTTLGFVAFPLVPARHGTLFDTPGIINPQQLTSHLNIEELKAVLPKKRIRPVTYRVAAGKTILLGGLARIDMLDGKPFFFTCCFAPTVRVHLTRIERADELLSKHIGTLLSPPFTVERYNQLGTLRPEEAVEFSLNGKGWNEAAADVVFPGLGWVALTGCGPIKLRVTMVAGVKATVREPLMPWEARKTMKRWTGGHKVH